jgi:hypothetical protein
MDEDRQWSYGDDWLRRSIVELGLEVDRDDVGMR